MNLVTTGLVGASKRRGRPRLYPELGALSHAQKQQRHRHQEITLTPEQVDRLTAAGALDRYLNGIDGQGFRVSGDREDQELINYVRDVQTLLARGYKAMALKYVKDAATEFESKEDKRTARFQSLDAEIGKDEDGNPFTLLDTLLVAEAGSVTQQSDSTLERIQHAVHVARLQEKAGRQYGN